MLEVRSVCRGVWGDARIQQMALGAGQVAMTRVQLEGIIVHGELGPVLRSAIQVLAGGKAPPLVAEGT